MKNEGEHWLRYVPRWLVAISGVVFLGTFIQQTYIAKQQFDIFGLRCGPVPHAQVQMISTGGGEIVIPFGPERPWTTHCYGREYTLELHTRPGEEGFVKMYRWSSDGRTATMEKVLRWNETKPSD